MEKTSSNLPTARLSPGQEAITTPKESQTPTLESEKVIGKRPKRDNAATTSKSESPKNNSQSESNSSAEVTTIETPSQENTFWQKSKRWTIDFGKAYKHAILRSYINLLLVFVPIGIAAEAAHLRPEIIFSMNSIAIIPLAGLLTHATETVAAELGDTLGALLNVSFGNAVELIIFIIALVKNEIRIVQASLLGSILSNLLLILGMAFLLGGLRYQEQIYNNTVTQMSACLLSLSVISLLLPTAFHASFRFSDAADRQTLKISRGVSIVLLFVYGLYLVFQLKSHSYLYTSMPQERIDEESHPGVLAPMFDASSSSSSDSSSSSSDTDTTSGSVTTVGRIKRAFRKRRKSSGSQSIDSRSNRSELSSPVNASYEEFSTLPSGYDVTYQKATDVKDHNSGDEADKDESGPSTTKIRDFEPTLPARSSDGATTPDIKLKGKKHRRKHRHSKHKKSKIDKHDKEDAISPKISVVNADHDTISNEKQVNFHEEESAPVNKTTSKINWKLGLPHILAENVFVDSTGKGRPGVRRTASLPDMNQVHVIPGRGLRPAQVPPPILQTTSSNPNDDSNSETASSTIAPTMSRSAAVVMLLLSTGLVAVCAEFLVDSIPALTENNDNVSQAFIGLIILPIVGNAAEHVTSITVAMKNKMDLSIGVAVGSSIQIALFVTPLVVILGWILDKEMSLYFTIFETISLFATAFVINFLILDGRSNYLEGTLLIACYVIIAVAAFFYPNDDDASEFGGGEFVNTTTLVARSSLSYFIQ